MRSEYAVNGFSLPAPDSRRSNHPWALLLLFTSVGAVAALRPSVLFVVLFVPVLIGVGYVLLKYTQRIGLEGWQMPLLAALSGYIILNYGFENITIHAGGLPLIISYLLMYVSLAMAIYLHRDWLAAALREPAMRCLLALIFITCLHLITDVPKYGLWAIRDASLCLDGIFLTLGFCWAKRTNSISSILQWLLPLLMVNLIYSFTFPWNEAIAAWSPSSGVFVDVPIFGNYRGNYVYLIPGALFCMILAKYCVRWPRWLLLLLAVAQIGGLAIHQARSMYLGLFLVMILLALFGKVKESGTLVGALLSVLVLIFLLTSVFQVQIQGRIGTINLAFFGEHLHSLSGAEGTPGANVEDRLDWADQAFDQIRAHPILGVGFGMPLIDFVDDRTGGAVRQPHNSSISILARLGAIGFAFWVWFHASLLWAFIQAFRWRRFCDRQLLDLILWLFVFYVIFMIAASVQPGFEFPSACIPFYFFMGLTVGLVRTKILQKVPKRNPAYQPQSVPVAG